MAAPCLLIPALLRLKIIAVGLYGHSMAIWGRRRRGGGYGSSSGYTPPPPGGGGGGGGSGSGGFLDALKSWAGFETVPGDSGNYNSDIDQPEEQDISSRISSWMSGGGSMFMGGLTGSHLSLAAATCSIRSTVPLPGNPTDFVIDFCGDTAVGFLDTLGGFVLAISYLSALLIVFKG